MDTKKIRIAIPHGDTNGIGYELIFKTFTDAEMLDMCIPIVYGSPKVAAYHRKAIGSQTNFNIIDNAEKAEEGCINILTCFDEEVKVDFGEPTQESGAAALKAMDRAMTDYRRGLFDVLVACPSDDFAIKDCDHTFSSMKKYIETSLNNGKKSLMMWLNDSMRIASVAQETSIKDVAKEITRENIERKAISLYESMRRDFLLDGSRIAVMSLNHEIGTEEENEIIPAVNELAGSIIGLFGPYTASQLFGEREYQDFDAVLAMYDDQATLPFETLSCEVGCRYLAGLPLVVTTIATDPHFEIAGQGRADETSFRHAIFAAIDIEKRRRAYDEAHANPLEKLYHEKRDEVEKPRFSIPQKRENVQKDKPQEEAKQ